MTDLKKGVQRGGGNSEGVAAPQGGDAGENNRGAEFGTADRATRGTNRDADPTGETKNQGHGHPDANNG